VDKGERSPRECGSQGENKGREIATGDLEFPALYLQILGGSRIITGLFGDAKRLLQALLPVNCIAVGHPVIAQFKERDG